MRPDSNGKGDLPSPMVECEIVRNDVWQTIGIAEAMSLQGERLRCVACHGRVLIAHRGRDEPPHFTHLQAYAYCHPEAGSSSPLHPSALS